jgi:hypothetical protein
VETGALHESASALIVAITFAEYSIAGVKQPAGPRDNLMGYSAALPCLHYFPFILIT